MIDKTRWLGLGPWHEDNESELIDWTVQPQYQGILKGNYYHAELRYSRVRNMASLPRVLRERLCTRGES